MQNKFFTDATMRWEPVPNDCLDNVSSGCITGTHLRDDETVEWLFHHDVDGNRMVYGYVIKKKEKL